MVSLGERGMAAAYAAAVLPRIAVPGSSSGPGRRRSSATAAVAGPSFAP